MWFFRFWISPAPRKRNNFKSIINHPLATAGSLMPHQRLWWHLPLMDVRLRKLFCIYYLPTEWLKMQSCILAFSWCWSSFLLDTPLFSLFPCTYESLQHLLVTCRENPTHFKQNSMWTYFVSACNGFCSHLFSTDFFQFLTAIEKKRPHPNNHRLVPFQGISCFHALKIDCSWRWASTVTYVPMKGMSQREMSQ